VRIESITIMGFRSFGPAPHRISLAGELTAVVGPNASGKTALLQALAKLFGVTRAQRTIHRSDFHLPVGVPPDDRTTRELFIDVVISLPELAKGSATADTVAPAFRHMHIAAPKASPVCRMRLEARWQDDGTADGEVTQELFWIDRLDEKIDDDHKHAVSPVDRGLIQFYYTPASRDAGAQSRVEPAEVRYCRCDPKTRVSTVKPVEMPVEASEAAKFVRGAMLAFPELYFARFVILVEGDSERVVLPRLAEAEGIILDPSFVAVVPLGGRHVQHFWRLLNGLAIPHATLLDLDLGRSGGGFGRVKTIIGHLIEGGTPREQLLTVKGGKVLSPDEFEAMHDWNSSDAATLAAWVADLRKYAVYFSEPLDLDMSMLAAFPAAYEKSIPAGGGPKMAADAAAKIVLGEGGAGLDAYKDALAELGKYMPAYRYHFLTRSKPATHLQAFVHLDDTAIKKGMPEAYGLQLRSELAASR
jgi:energy-coupling factor transporter ATP-binding protein EcfA2